MKRIDVRDLEAQNQVLDREIHRLERRGIHMTPTDRVQASELKKRRLATKDELYTLRGR
jgi:uncharacterized protein YdcH (DUF465 family)